MGLNSEMKCCRDCGKPLSVTQRGNALYCFSCADKRRKKRGREYAKRYAREHKEEIAEYQKERRNWLKSKGFCVVCGSEKAADGLTKCPACREKSHAYNKKYSKKKYA